MHPCVSKSVVHGKEGLSSVLLKSPHCVSAKPSPSDYLQLQTKPIPGGALKYRPRRQPSIGVWKLSTCKSAVALLTAGTFGSGWSCYWSRGFRKSKGKIKTNRQKKAGAAAPFSCPEGVCILHCAAARV